MILLIFKCMVPYSLFKHIFMSVSNLCTSDGSVHPSINLFIKNRKQVLKTNQYNVSAIINMKVIVDTDPGIDDAIALGILLSRKSTIDILAITCVNGNISVEKATENALKLLELFDRKDIPVYQGAENPLLACEHTGSYYHGNDGLGDVHHDKPDYSPLQKEHAVLAINRLVKENPGEITLITLGPLTNIALALRLNPSLANELKELVVMGGNYKGEGNISMGAEFNFFIDPSAAHIALEELKCPKYIITWELSKQQYLSEDDFRAHAHGGNKQSSFFKKLYEKRDMYVARPGICDAVAVAVAVDRDIIKKKHEVYGTVILEGTQAKGLLVIDWNPHFRQIGEKKEKNLIIVDEIDHERYAEIVIDSTS